MIQRRRGKVNLFFRQTEGRRQKKADRTWKRPGRKHLQTIRVVFSETDSVRERVSEAGGTEDYFADITLIQSSESLAWSTGESWKNSSFS